MQNPSIKYILKLSIPIFFANLAIPLVGIIDTGLMGNLGNLSYLSATSVAANLFSMIFWSFGFLRMGTVGLVSQAYGKEDYSEIFNIVVRNLVFVLLISLILILLQSHIFNLSVGIFNLSDTTKQFYQDYFQIRIYSAPGELTLYIVTGLFVGLQKTNTSSLAVGLFSILNIIFSIILVSAFDLNIKGVAYGTLFSALLISTTFLGYTFWYLNKMSKIKKEELEVLHKQENAKVEIQNRIGMLQIEIHSLSHAHLGVQEEQNKTKQELEESYGKINIDLKDGSYEVIEEENK